MDYANTIARFARELPKFPDGRIDYTNADTAPVLTCFVESDGKILLLKRSDRVRAYQGKWNTVAGYLDEAKPIEDKAREEAAEELGIKDNDITEIRTGRAYEFKDEDIGMTWLVFPVLIKLKTRPDIKLDWEHTACQWIDPDELSRYDTVKNLDKSLARAME